MLAGEIEQALAAIQLSVSTLILHGKKKRLMGGSQDHQENLMSEIVATSLVTPVSTPHPDKSLIKKEELTVKAERRAWQNKGKEEHLGCGNRREGNKEG